MPERKKNCCLEKNRNSFVKSHVWSEVDEQKKKQY